MNSLAERLAARAAVDPETGCLNWAGARTPTGYGHISVGGFRRLVHRVAYEIHVGPIPDGLHIDHLCRNRACCNPDHLEAVTPAENNARSNSPSALLARATHCVHGHEFTPENTRRTGGHRTCRVCAKARDRARAERKRRRFRSATASSCPAGHPYDAENTRVDPRGNKVCRTCDRERQRKRSKQREQAAPATAAPLLNTSEVDEKR